MTEKEFYEEFGNIDPELIEAAAPKARKGKKILAVKLIAVAACLTVIIISAFMIVPRLVPEETTDIPQEEPKNIERKIFVYDPYDSSGNIMVDVNFWHDRGFLPDAWLYRFETDDIEEKERVFEILGKEYRMKHTGGGSRRVKTPSEKVGSMMLDSYREENTKGTEGMHITIYRETGQIFSLSTGEDYRYPIGTAIISKEEVCKIANEAIVSIYGEEIAAKYQLKEVISGGNYGVVFARYVHGIPTNDEIHFSISHDGRLLRVRADMFGAFENMENEVSEADIEESKKLLINNVSEDVDISYYQIMLNEDGKYYLCLTGNMRTEAGGIFYAYVNIN